MARESRPRQREDLVRERLGGTEVKVDGLDAQEFQKLADEAKQGCPVSRALDAIDIGPEAKLA